VPDEVADELDEAVERARERELDARVALERAAEQVRHLELQRDTLLGEADEVERALAEAARRRELRRRASSAAASWRWWPVRRQALDRSIAAAAESARRRGWHPLEHGRERRRATIREELDRITAELDASVSCARGRLRRADVERRPRERCSSGRARSCRSPPTRSETSTRRQPATTRDALERREDELVRKIGLLGRVNPLALEEFKALEERHAFLSDQLDDLRRSKRDLAEVVTAVDERIREVFREAYEDVAREFELTFQTVFPGGHGRLVLTDAEDLLTAGIEVEARPPGKRSRGCRCCRAASGR
jgi:chromosome segregation protein